MRNITEPKLPPLAKEQIDGDDLARLGYKSDFVREYGYFETTSFAFSIVGLSSCIASTFNTPLLAGGPAAVVWCWLIASIMCFTLAISVAELVSAFPTSGGMYTASALLVPKKYRAPVGFLVGWLNLIGQIAAVASPEFALSQMIWSAYTISTGDEFTPSKVQIVGVFAGLLILHGAINSLNTRLLARITRIFVFINFFTTFSVILAFLTSGQPHHDLKYIFTTVVNRTGWDNTGLAFMFGLLSAEWTLTDYDATAHISEEVKRPAKVVPFAIITAIGTSAVLGFVLNVILVMYSGELSKLPGKSGLAVATIMSDNLDASVFNFLWGLICLNAFFQVNVALQSCSRTLYAFSRDGGIPDRGWFGKLTSYKTPVHAVWIIVLVAIGFGSLDFASTVAVNAIFSLTATALDSSYAVPIIMKLLFMNHPEVNFKPGPFNLGKGYLMWFINLTAIGWVSFICLILSFPTVQPITFENMNYSWVIGFSIVTLSMLWYFLQASKWYRGPIGNLVAHELHPSK
ncbi:amino acid/polyamine transporter I [Melampsora americana]|nr:amino acid/polyamine transporter I [Melampsora americana]